MSSSDTRPAVAAKAGDWVELRNGEIVGPLLDLGGSRLYPLGGGGGMSWMRNGQFHHATPLHSSDIVAIVPRPTEPVKADDSPPDHDPVNHPSHYTSHPSGVECIDITEAFSFNLGNAIKYIWRAGLKSPDAAEDLRKAAWYVNREIKRIEAKQ